MALYETVFITRQDLSADNVDALTQKLSDILSGKKGKVVSKEYWGLRDLSYKIKKNARGHYVCINIDSDFEAVAELKRVMGFDEDIIRYDIFKVEEHKKTPSALALSVNAKDYKAGKDPELSEDLQKIDDLVKKIVINN